MQSKAEGTTTNTPSRQAVARDGAVLPMVYGRGRVAAQWVTPVLHWTYRNTTKSSYAFFSCFAELCLGPIDEVVQIYVNGKPYHGIYADRADYPSDDYIESVLAKETPETFRVYWGLETQSGLTSYVQSLIRGAGHSEASKTHPNYLGRVVMGVQDMEAGQTFNGQTPQLPNVEVEVYRRSPTAYSLGGVAWGTHPIGVIKDVLTDTRGGLGLSSSLFDSTHWTDAMDRFVADGAAGKTGTDLYISPVLGEQREAGQIVSDVLSYFDGLVRQRNGKIEIDWQPNDGTTTSPTGLRELSIHDMTADPQLDAQGIEDMVTQVAVTGLDYAADVPLTEATESAQVPYAREIIGEPRTQKIDRPWFVNREQIRGYAQTIAAARSSPAITGRITVRRESATQPDNVTPLRPGDRFNLDYAPRSLDIVCRITERVDSDDRAEVQLKFQSERGASPEPYVPALDPRAEIAPPLPPVPSRFIVAQYPPDLAPDDSNYATALVERSETNQSSFETHFSPTNSWPGQVIEAGNSKWAVGAVFTGSLASSTTDTTINVDTVGEEFSRFASASALEQDDNKLLMHHGGEWFSVGTITPLGAGAYTLAIKRARLGSYVAAHSIGSVALLIYAADMTRLSNVSFDDIYISGVYNSTQATKYFKVRSSNAAGNSALSSAVSLVMIDKTPSAPSGLVGTAKPGYNLIEWDPSTSLVVNEYTIYVSTVSAFAGFVFLAQTAASQYSDGAVVAGTSYWYKVAAESDAGTPSVEIGPVGPVVALSSLSATVPSSPTATTDLGSGSAGTYNATGGGVMSYRTFSVPALPANAVWQNLLYRRNGASEWLVAAQLKNTSSVSVRLDDLTPGVSYDIATQAWSGAGGSSVVTATGSPFTAPSKTANPDTPGTLTYTAGNSSSFNHPAFFGPLGVQFMLKVEWAVPSGQDVKKWQWVATTTDSDAAADAAANPVGPGLQPNYVSVPRAVLNSDFAGGGSMYFRVRSINDSGVASAWGGGGTNISSLYTQPAGVGNAASKNVGTTAGTVAAGNDSRFPSSTPLVASSNLSDLTSTSTARSNLGLGDMATRTGSSVGALTGTTYTCSALNVSGAAVFSSGWFSIGSCTITGGGLEASNGFFVGGNRVVYTRGTGVSSAGTGYNASASTSDFNGSDTIDLAAYVSDRNAIASALNNHGARINDIISRLQAHGLIS